MVLLLQELGPALGFHPLHPSGGSAVGFHGGSWGRGTPNTWVLQAGVGLCWDPVL